MPEEPTLSETRKRMSLPERLDAFVRGSRRGLLLSYLALFVVFLALFSSGLLVNGKGFIWYIDGLEQQYMFFIMQGEWLRELLSNIFIDHSFTIPMWSDRIGYGADYVLSVQNTLGNPINWLSVFFTASTADFGLQATIPITLFLAGLAFLGYCSYKGFDRYSSLIASMVYVFGGYSVIAYMQIYMLYPLVLGPLVLWGVDRVFDRKSPFLFIGAMALCFFCSVSMGYTSCLLLLVYCLVKVFNLGQRTTLKGFLVWTLKIAGYTAMGCLIGCILFVPGAISILTQDRLGLDRPDNLLYSLGTYIAFLGGFINLASVGQDCYYGFAPIAFLCVVALFACKGDDDARRTRRILAILFVVLSVFLCLPFFGRVFNGFAYANNRWVWAYCLLVSCLVAYSLPLLRAQLAEGRKGVAAAVVAYLLLFVVVLIWYVGKSLLSSLCVLLLTAMLCYVFCKKKSRFDLAVLGTVMLSCFLVSFQCADGISSNQVGLGRAYNSAYTENAASVLAENIDDVDDARYDTAKVISYRNGNWANGMKDQTFYNSIYNGSIDDYHTSLGLATSSMNFAYSTLNSRSALEALGGTEYFVTVSGDDSYLPPAFDEAVGEKTIRDKAYAAYRTDEVLPLAFLYDSAVSRDFYDSLSLMERQDILTQKVVVDNASGDEVFERYTFEIPSSFSYGKPDGNDAFKVADPLSPEEKEASTKIDGNSITIKQPNTVLYLDADIPANTEAYFACEGMDFKELDDSEKPATARGIKQKREAFQADLLRSGAKECKIIVYGDDTSQEIWFMNNKHHLYGGKDDWAVNVGYSDEERDGIALLFDTPGTYFFDSYGVFASDTLNVEEDVERLAMQGAENIRETDNGYACDVTVPHDGEYLYFRIPYGAGWSATVNGQPAEIVKANLGFMALPLDAGTYSVELRYETPGLMWGFALSGAGILILIAFALARGPIRRKIAANGLAEAQKPEFMEEGSKE